MLEEKDMPILNEAQPSQLELVLNKVELKRESIETTVIQIEGTLLRSSKEQEHIVIALHVKDEADQYVHLQQYEFDYHIDQFLEKQISISALVLSELDEKMTYHMEVKLLAKHADQQWHTIQSSFITL